MPHSHENSTGRILFKRSRDGGVWGDQSVTWESAERQYKEAEFIEVQLRAAQLVECRGTFYWESFMENSCRENKLNIGEDKTSQRMRSQKIRTDY